MTIEGRFINNQIKMRLILLGKLPSLNEHDKANRANRYVGASMKKTYTDGVFWDCRAQKLEAILRPVAIVCTWYRTNKRSDPDNICFAKKYILDGLVKAGILMDDGWDEIKRFEDHFRIGKEDKVIVELT